MRGQRSAHPLVKPEYIVLEEAEAIIRGAHLVGAVVSFDADVLDRRMRAHGICPSWHYHLIDVEALAIGYLRGRGWPKAHWGDPEARSGEAFDPAQLPWKSDDLSAALGVTVSDEDRHTALGDAKWAMRVYDAVMGGTS
jgi:DNA polymerase III epsilon subunit-like protein